LGEEFGHQVAAITKRLVLVARRRSRMDDLARVLRGAYPGLEVHVFECDLRDHASLDHLVNTLAQRGLVPDLLVNNAGLGDYGDFAQADWGRIDSMLEVNIRALTRLCHAVAPAMMELGRGAILNVSSLAGEVPVPDFAVYAATKAYVTSFTEALRMELRGSGIRVLALCPGPVPTEFGDVARRRGGADPAAGVKEWFKVDAGQVVAEALDALEADKAKHFPGFWVCLAALGISLLPMALVRAVMSARPRRTVG
jgi:hypothetical protein